jgi:hypothetical protein
LARKEEAVESRSLPKALMKLRWMARWPSQGEDRHFVRKIARKGKLAKLATLPKEEEYQDLDIGGLKIANFANSLSLAIFPVLVAIFSLPVVSPRQQSSYRRTPFSHLHRPVLASSAIAK